MEATYAGQRSLGVQALAGQAWDGQATAVQTRVVQDVGQASVGGVLEVAPAGPRSSAVQNVDLDDVVAQVDMLQRRNADRAKWARAQVVEYFKRKSNENDTPEKASQPRKRPDVETSNEDIKLAKCAKTDPKHKPATDCPKIAKQGGKQGAKPNPVKDSASLPIQRDNIDVKPATFKAPVGAITRTGNPQMGHVSTRFRYTCRTGWSGTNQCCDFSYEEVSGLMALVQYG